MLVLTRKRGEKVVIGDGVEITVLTVERNRVKLGFTAPGKVSIYRQEIGRRKEACPPLAAHHVQEVEAYT